MSGGMGGGEAGVDPPTTTKGDLSGFDTTFDRVPIGANSTILTADSTEALGLKWAAPATPASEFPIVLGNTSVAAGSTNATLNALSLTDSTLPPLKPVNQGIAGLAGLSFQPTAANSVGHVLAIPSGTSNRSQFTTSRQNNPSTNGDLLTMGSDIVGSNEQAVRTYSTGTGTTRDLKFYYDTTERLKVESAGVAVTGTFTVNGSALEATPLWKLIVY
jgi:hypothetical protein